MASISQDSYRIIDPVLTTLSQGYQNASMIAESLFPTLQVSYNKGRIPKFNKTAFISRETVRATGARSNRINELEYDLVPFELIENDVEMSLDYIEEEDAENWIKLEQKIIKDLSDIINMGKEKQAADYAQNPYNYASQYSTDCQNNQFVDPDVNPVDIIRDSIEKLRSKIGRQPNTLVMGPSTYSALMNSPSIIDRVKYSGIRKVNTTTLSELFEVPIIKVGYAQYTDNNSDFKDIWRDSLILAFVNENEKGTRTQFNPSYGYTLQRKGLPEVDTYYENGGKSKIIRYTDNYVLKVTCPEAAHLLYNCVYPQN